MPWRLEIPGVATAWRQLNEAFENQEVLASLDFSKCFDFVHPGLAIENMQLQGLPDEWANILMFVWGHQVRWLCLGKAVHPTPEHVQTSMPQGDAFAPLALIMLLIRPLHDGPTSDSETSAADSETPRPSDSETCRPSDSETSAADSETSRPSDSETRCPSDSETPRPSDSETFRPSDSETPRPSDSETCLSPRIRKLQRRIRKFPGPRIRKLAFPPGFGNFSVGFGNFQALGFGNLPFSPDSETSTLDSETSRPSDSETLSPTNCIIDKYISIYWILG